MPARIILGCLFVFVFVSETDAQSRIRRQTSRIFRGLASRIDGATPDRQASVGSLAATEDELATEMGNETLDQHLEHRNFGAFSSASRNDLEATDKAARAVSIEDVVTMVQRGLGDKTILQYVGNNGVKKKLVVSEIIYLHDQGVSEPVIQAMQMAQVFQIPRTPESHQLRNRAAPMAPKQRPADLEFHGPSVLVAP